MSAAFWSSKRQRINPFLDFEIKNDTEYVFVPRYMDKSPYKVYKKGRYYEICQDDLEKFLKQQTVEYSLPDLRYLMEVETKFKYDLKFEETQIFKCLFDYQKKGVRKVIECFNGRAMIGDEMGLGKTLQAIAVFKYYKSKSLLVICPAYLRYTWKHEISKWLDVEATVINSGKDVFEGDIVIVSYELATKQKKLNFDMIICDESHYLKGHKTKRTKTLTPMLKKSPYLLLLTGTPALNRPCELYPQCHVLRPDLFKNWKHFTKRYCDGKISPLGYYDFSGSSKKFELNWLIKKTVMVRRLKRDVLTELPKKHRSEIYLKVKQKDLKPLKGLFNKWFVLNEKIKKLEPGSDAIKKASFERKVLITELYRKSSVAKINAVKKVIKDMVDQGLKFIVFCYHKAFMDEIETMLTSYIRIDGNTPVPKRQEYVDQFQNGDVQVALLSLLAASTGFTLTSTSLMVFGELYFVPGTMLQAEDRIHRIGQTESCDIRYIIGEGTLDDYIFKMIIRKLDTLDSVLDCRDDRNFI